MAACGCTTFAPAHSSAPCDLPAPQPCTGARGCACTYALYGDCGYWRSERLREDATLDQLLEAFDAALLQELEERLKN